MAGWTPLFEGLLDGTLYGKWPVNGLWVLILSQSDKNGLIDMVPEALAARIGCDLATLQHAIAELMAPDDKSRSQECEGRRLLPIDPARSWGWRVVNHSQYREKARKQAWDAARTESGANAERMRAARAADKSVPDSADVCREVPSSSDGARSQTQTHLQTQTHERENGEFPVNLNVQAWEEWLDHRRTIGKPIKSARTKTLAMQQLASLGDSDYQAQCVEHSRRSGYQGLYEPHQKGGKSFMQTQAALLADEGE